jgi:myo-inositol-1(or 4)-monophosphatase
MDYQATLTSVIPVIMEAGNIVLQYFENTTEHVTKSAETDIVTEADKAGEAYITPELHRLFPDHYVHGEEGGGSGASAATAEYYWYVDPIDGTTNYANNIPHFSVLLAMTDRNMQPLIGIVYDPMRDELFTATKGGGAFLNGQPIRTSKKTELMKSVVASGFPYDKHIIDDNNTRQWSAFVKRVRGVRRFGSAGLDFAWVAAGRFEGYWERSLNPWDALAGILLVREAGGMVTDYYGDPNPQHGKEGRYLASNGLLHDSMIAVLKESYGIA